MTLETAIRLTEILLALAMMQQSAEHLVGPRAERILFGLRFILAGGLILGWAVPWVLAGLLVLAIVALHRFEGPYNGGCDRMTLLLLICLCAAHGAPTMALQEMAIGYAAVQLILSYVVSGWVKILNPDWRRGKALCDVFRFSAYPVSEGLRGLAARPRLLLGASWAVMVLELTFPLALLHPAALVIALMLTAAFHLANACVFGLNRFFWIWLSAYPALIWFQGRVDGVLL